jgi:hypothetical protein
MTSAELPLPNIPSNKMVVAVVDTGPNTPAAKIPITPGYAGSLDLDTLINAIMTDHGPRLNAGNFQAAFWAYFAGARVAEVRVNCDWRSEDEKLGILAFALLPLAALELDEVVWIADVALGDVLDKTYPGVTSALLVVSYRTNGVYPFAFPYSRMDFNNPSYEEACFTDVTVPSGFLDTALRSMVEPTDEHGEPKPAAKPAGKHLGAALASAWGHQVSFPG